MDEEDEDLEGPLPLFSDEEEAEGEEEEEGEEVVEEEEDEEEEAEEAKPTDASTSTSDESDASYNFSDEEYEEELLASEMWLKDPKNLDEFCNTLLNLASEETIGDIEHGIYILEKSSERIFRDMKDPAAIGCSYKLLQIFSQYHQLQDEHPTLFFTVADGIFKCLLHLTCSQFNGLFLKEICCDMILHCIDNFLKNTNEVQDEWCGNIELKANSMKVFQRFCALCKDGENPLLYDRITKKMNSWIGCVFPYIFYAYRKVRVEAFDAIFTMYEGFPHQMFFGQPCWSELKDDFSCLYAKGLSYLAWRNAPGWFQVWRFLFDIFDQEKEVVLHNLLINKLLEVEEWAFISSYPEARMAAFLCWKELVNRFLDPSSDDLPRRLTLFLKPLICTNSKTVYVTHAKLDILWYILHKLQPVIEKVGDYVLPQFLTLCYAPGGEFISFWNECGNPLMRDEPTMLIPLLDSIAQLLNPDCKESTCKEYTLQGFENPFIPNAQFFVRHSRLLFLCVAECTVVAGKSIMGESDDKKCRTFYVPDIWKNLMYQIKGALKIENKTDEERKSLTALIRNLILFLQYLPSVQLADICVTPILETVLLGDNSLPLLVLYSKLFESNSNSPCEGTPLNYLVNLILSPHLLENNGNKHGYVSILDHVLWAGISELSMTVKFTEAVLRALERSLSERKPRSKVPMAVEAWLKVYKNVKSLITAGFYNDLANDDASFRWLFSILSFPMKFMNLWEDYQVTRVIKAWTYFAIMFGRAAIASGESDTFLCEKLCHFIQTDLEFEWDEVMFEDLQCVVQMYAAAIHLLGDVNSSHSGAESLQMKLKYSVMVLKRILATFQRVSSDDREFMDLAVKIMICTRNFLRRVRGQCEEAHIWSFSPEIVGDIIFMLNLLTVDREESTAYIREGVSLLQEYARHLRQIPFEALLPMFHGLLTHPANDIKELAVALWRNKQTTLLAKSTFKSHSLKTMLKECKQIVGQAPPSMFFAYPHRIHVSPKVEVQMIPQINVLPSALTQEFNYGASCSSFLDDDISVIQEIPSINEAAVLDIHTLSPSSHQVLSTQPLQQSLNCGSAEEIGEKRILGHPLTSHEIHKLREGRDDVPSLYIDLTQDSQRTCTYEESSHLVIPERFKPVEDLLLTPSRITSYHKAQNNRSETSTNTPMINLANAERPAKPKKLDIELKNRVKKFNKVEEPMSKVQDRLLKQTVDPIEESLHLLFDDELECGTSETVVTLSNDAIDSCEALRAILEDEGPESQCSISTSSKSRKIFPKKRARRKSKSGIRHKYRFKPRWKGNKSLGHESNCDVAEVSRADQLNSSQNKAIKDHSRGSQPNRMVLKEAKEDIEVSHLSQNCVEIPKNDLVFRYDLRSKEPECYDGKSSVEEPINNIRGFTDHTTQALSKEFVSPNKAMEKNCSSKKSLSSKSITNSTTEPCFPNGENTNTNVPSKLFGINTDFFDKDLSNIYPTESEHRSAVEHNQTADSGINISDEFELEQIAGPGHNCPVGNSLQMLGCESRVGKREVDCLPSENTAATSRKNRKRSIDKHSQEKVTNSTKKRKVNKRHTSVDLKRDASTREELSCSPVSKKLRSSFKHTNLSLFQGSLSNIPKESSSNILEQKGKSSQTRKSKASKKNWPGDRTSQQPMLTHIIRRDSLSQINNQQGKHNRYRSLHPQSEQNYSKEFVSQEHSREKIKLMKQLHLFPQVRICRLQIENNFRISSEIAPNDEVHIESNLRSVGRTCQTKEHDTHNKNNLSDGKTDQISQKLNLSIEETLNSSVSDDSNHEVHSVSSVDGEGFPDTQTLDQNVLLEGNISLLQKEEVNAIPDRAKYRKQPEDKSVAVRTQRGVQRCTSTVNQSSSSTSGRLEESIKENIVVDTISANLNTEPGPSHRLMFGEIPYEKSVDPDCYIVYEAENAGSSITHSRHADPNIPNFYIHDVLSSYENSDFTTTIWSPQKWNPKAQPLKSALRNPVLTRCKCQFCRKQVRIPDFLTGKYLTFHRSLFEPLGNTPHVKDSIVGVHEWYPQQLTRDMARIHERIRRENAALSEWLQWNWDRISPVSRHAIIENRLELGLPVDVYVCRPHADNELCDGQLGNNLVKVNGTIYERNELHDDTWFPGKIIEVIEAPDAEGEIQLLAFKYNNIGNGLIVHDHEINSNDESYENLSSSCEDLSVIPLDQNPLEKLPKVEEPLGKLPKIEELVKKLPDVEEKPAITNLLRFGKEEEPALEQTSMKEETVEQCPVELVSEFLACHSNDPVNEEPMGHTCVDIPMACHQSEPSQQDMKIEPLGEEPGDDQAFPAPFFCLLNDQSTETSINEDPSTCPIFDEAMQTEEEDTPLESVSASLKCHTKNASVQTSEEWKTVMEMYFSSLHCLNDASVQTLPEEETQMEGVSTGSKCLLTDVSVQASATLANASVQASTDLADASVQASAVGNDISSHDVSIQAAAALADASVQASAALENASVQASAVGNDIATQVSIADSTDVAIQISAPLADVAVQTTVLTDASVKKSTVLTDASVQTSSEASQVEDSTSQPIHKEVSVRKSVELQHSGESSRGGGNKKPGVSRRPLYPPLMGCEDCASSLVQDLTDPSRAGVLYRRMVELGIVTVGDFCSQSRSAIRRLPVTTPKLNTVLAVLKKYEHQKSPKETVSRHESVDLVGCRLNNRPAEPVTTGRMPVITRVESLKTLAPAYAAHINYGEALNFWKENENRTESFEDADAQNIEEENTPAVASHSQFSQGLVEDINSDMTSEEPVFPALQDCSDDISNIIGALTDTIWSKPLIEKLTERGIFTVGDLCSKSAAYIQQLPIKEPKLSSTLSVLENYRTSRIEREIKVIDLTEEDDDISPSQGSSDVEIVNLEEESNTVDWANVNLEEVVSNIRANQLVRAILDSPQRMKCVSELLNAVGSVEQVIHFLVDVKVTELLEEYWKQVRTPLQEGFSRDVVEFVTKRVLAAARPEHSRSKSVNASFTAHNPGPSMKSRQSLQTMVKKHGWTAVCRLIPENDLKRFLASSDMDTLKEIFPPSVVSDLIQRELHRDKVFCKEIIQMALNSHLPASYNVAASYWSSASAENICNEEQYKCVKEFILRPDTLSFIAQMTELLILLKPVHEKGPNRRLASSQKSILPDAVLKNFLKIVCKQMQPKVFFKECSKTMGEHR